ncbi:MAG: hypothetical protein LBD27_01580 [Tannerella sp.]|jgi:hypothetical protein|nr:hypothetical protein [Tannerella sp.]
MAKTSFDKAYDSLNRDEQHDIEKIMEQWPPRIAENFRREHFLPVLEMKELMRFMIANKDMSYADMQKKMRRLFYTDFQLQGKPVQTSPRRVGFAIPAEVYKKHLRKKYFGLFLYDEVELKTFVDGIKNIDTVKEKFKDDLDSTLKEYLIWVTWEVKEDFEDNPFYFDNSDTCEGVQMALALDEIYKTPNVILFIVDAGKLNRDALVRPTFCDADFGNKFRPAPIRFTAHGYTYPLSEPPLPYSEEKHLKEGRPEAVIRSEHIVLSKIKEVILLNK